MPFELDENKSTYQIKAFKPGIIQINDTMYHHSVIITAEKLIEDWAPQSIEELTQESFSPIIDLHPDILLIGTGSKLIFIDLSLYGDLINQGIGVEMMDTAAACRTFNALTAENRNVAAALVIR